MNDDIKSFARLLVVQIGFGIAAATMVQVGALYIVWDALNNRMNDFSNRLDGFAAQLGNVREDIGFLKARFEALDKRLDAEIGSLNNKLDTEIGALGTRLEARISALDKRLETEIGSLNKRLDDFASRMDDFTDRMDGLNAQQAAFAIQLGSINEDIGFLKAKIGNLDNLTRIVQANATRSDADQQRLIELEARLKEALNRVADFQTRTHGLLVSIADAQASATADQDMPRRLIELERIIQDLNSLLSRITTGGDIEAPDRLSELLGLRPTTPQKGAPRPRAGLEQPEDVTGTPARPDIQMNTSADPAGPDNPGTTAPPPPQR